ncbi:MAG: hypothetical protein WCP20_04980 [Desulfuromonadales bacterium]
MRNNLFNVVAVFLSAMTLVLTGCGSDGGGTQNGTYLPVTVNSTWTYNSGARTEKITANTNNQITREVVTSTGKSVATETVSSNAFYLTGRETYDTAGTKTNSITYGPMPGMLFVPSSTAPGYHETQTVQISVQPANTTSSLTQNITVVGFETISVPAGTFSNTLKIETAISNTTYLSWFALNIGMIRQDVNNITAFELTAYSIK